MDGAVSQLVRSRRLALDLSVRELGRQCGCSGGRISQIEGGQLPGLGLAVALCDALSIDEVEMGQALLADSRRLG
jgi:transcriptional regulator with XRE-family HTH domain